MTEGSTGINPTTTQEWILLSAAQKREQRLNWWRSSSKDIQFVDSTAAQAYQVRIKRLINVYNVQEPDRVPVSLHLGSLPISWYGIDYYTAMNDYEKLEQAYTQFNERYSAVLET